MVPIYAIPNIKIGYIFLNLGLGSILLRSRSLPSVAGSQWVNIVALNKLKYANRVFDSNKFNCFCEVIWICWKWIGNDFFWRLSLHNNKKSLLDCPFLFNKTIICMKLVRWKAFGAYYVELKTQKLDSISHLVDVQSSFEIAASVVLDGFKRNDCFTFFN